MSLPIIMFEVYQGAFIKIWYLVLGSLKDLESRTDSSSLQLYAICHYWPQDNFYEISLFSKESFEFPPNSQQYVFLTLYQAVSSCCVYIDAKSTFCPDHCT